MIRFGVLGAGRIGKVHARSIQGSGRATVAYVADAIPQSAEDLAKTTGAAVKSVDEIIAAKDVDAILIGTPTDTHADLIEAGSKAGKAILCEKPVSLSVARIEQCVKIAAQNKKPLMIGFNRRFDPNFAALEKRLRAGEIGEIEIVTVISRDPEPPPVSYVERSGGLYRDMMIHDFDMARFLLGEDPITVHALGSVLVDPGIGKAGDVDTAAVHMQTASGKIAVITNSRRASYGYDQRIEVHGSKGMLRAGNVNVTTVESAKSDGFSSGMIPYFFVERYADAYRRELEAFLDAVEKGTPVAPSVHDGLMAQKLADAATESWKSGKTVKI